MELFFLREKSKKHSHKRKKKRRKIQLHQYNITSICAPKVKKQSQHGLKQVHVIFRAFRNFLAIKTMYLFQRVLCWLIAQIARPQPRVGNSTRSPAWMMGTWLVEPCQLPSGVHHSRQWDGKWSQDSEPGTLTGDVDFPGSIVTTAPNTCLFSFESLFS